MTAVNRYIGASIERVEDLRFLRGRGEYVADLEASIGLGPTDSRRGGITRAVVGLGKPIELYRRHKEPPLTRSPQEIATMCETAHTWVGDQRVIS